MVINLKKRRLIYHLDTKKVTTILVGTYKNVRRIENSLFTSVHLPNIKIQTKIQKSFSIHKSKFQNRNESVIHLVLKEP